jgi:hypothetical protein
MIQVLELEKLSAGSSDHLTNHRKKPCLQYYTEKKQPNQNKLDILIHGFTGETCKNSYTELFISGSHQHPEFFQLLAKYWNVPTSLVGSSATWYVKLQIRELNEIVKDIKQEKPMKTISKHIKLHLSEKNIQNLPNEFYGVYLPVKEPSISFIHPQTLRCQTNTTSNTIRWKVLYSCIFFPDTHKLNEEKDLKRDTSYSCFPRPQAARTFEMKHMNIHSVEPLWPFSIKPLIKYNQDLLKQIKDSMDQHGLVTIPLSDHFIQQYIRYFESYMKQIMKCPPDKDLFNIETLRNSEEKEKIYHYRNTEQSFSKHIPGRHGRTHYGHYCPALKQLFLNVTPVVSHALKALYPDEIQGYITTSELIIQYS